MFEVDSAADAATEAPRVDAALGGAPPNLTYVTIDFNRDKLGDALRQAGYDPKQKTFFTWEGVSMYVAEEGVRETLRTIATQSAPGSSLVMDYTTKTSLEFMAKFPQFGPANFWPRGASRGCSECRTAQRRNSSPAWDWSRGNSSPCSARRRSSGI